MSVLPANTSGPQPVEALFFAGYSKGNYANSRPADLLGVAGVFHGPWEDVSGYCEFRLLSWCTRASAVGGVLIEWSMDGATIRATEVAGTALAGVLYDSGVIAYHMPFVRISYTNGGVAMAPGDVFQLRLLFSPTAVGGGGGGGPAANVNIISPLGITAPAAGVSVTAAADQSSLPAPDPAGILSTSMLPEIREPDGVLRARARVLTDEGMFGDDFGDQTYPASPSLFRPLAGTLTLTTGSPAWSRSSAATPLREGDYLSNIADDVNPAVPRMVQIDTFTPGSGGLSGTLVTAYTGAGGVAQPGQISNFWRKNTGVGGAPAGPGVANSALGLCPGTDVGAVASCIRGLTYGGRKGTSPLYASIALKSISVRQANQTMVVGFMTTSGASVLPPIALFSFSGAVITAISTYTKSEGGAGDREQDNYSFPNGGDTTTQHILEIWQRGDRVSWAVDGVPYPDRLLHFPYPYEPLAIGVEVGNQIGFAGVDSTTLINSIIVRNVDEVDVRVSYPVDANVQALALTRPSPDPAASLNPTKQSLQVGPAGSLMTRGQVLTDEGAYSGVFPGASAYRALAANITMTTGSVVVVGNTGSLFTSQVRVGDYVEITAQRLETAPVMRQVASIQDDTHLTLRTPWGGATATGPAEVTDFVIFCTGNLNDVVGVGASAINLQVGIVNGARSYIARQLGAGGLKGAAPVRLFFDAQIDHRRAAVGRLAQRFLRDHRASP